MSTRVTRTPHDQLGLTDDDVLSMYRIGIMARLIDEAAFRQNRMGRAPFVVPVSGHEGCQIGTGWAMRRGTDIWLPYYRDLAVVLVAGMTPYEVFLGIFAKADDPSSARPTDAGALGLAPLGIITGSSPIATQIPHAAGIAYAAKYRGEDAVVATWFGDGATSEGDWHEGLNFAGIHKLPVIFVCENNHYAISVPLSKQMAVRDVAERAAGYGFPGVVVDGNDVLACYGAMKTGPRSRAGRRGPDADRVQDLPLPPAHVRRRRPDLPEPRGGGGGQASRPARRVRQVPGRARDPGRRRRRRSCAAPVKTEIDGHIAAAWDAPDPDPDDGSRARVRRGRMTEKNVVTADPRRAARRDRGGRARRPARRGRRRARRRLPDLRRLDERVRRASGDRHPARRVGHRRHRDRDGAARPAADRRDPVRRLHPPGLRPDRVARRRASAIARTATSASRW